MRLFFEKICIPPETNLLEAISVIDKGSLQLALIVDSNKILIGTLTDGDIRRGLLKGIDLDQKIEKIMNKKFFSIKNTDDFKSGFYKVSKMGIKKLPVVDQEGRIEFK